MYGGSVIATPSCQPLAPRIPGYRRYCPYTREPRPNGAWSAPDLARVDVWGTTNEIALSAALPAYVTDVLRSIGLRARLHVVPYEDISPAKRRRIQVSVDGDWLPEYPAASSYLPEFFGCDGGTSNGYVCDPALDRQMRAATMAQLSSPRRAAAVWTAVDHRLVDKAWWVPTVTLQAVGARVQAPRRLPVQPGDRLPRGPGLAALGEPPTYLVSSHATRQRRDCSVP
jgi:peptide/nickel transport system substrate-binding protein